MAVNLQFDFFERKRRLGAILGQHVEADLRVEDGFRQGLEGEQRNRLLLQFFDSGLAALTYGLKTSTTALRIVPAFWRCVSRSAMEIAAGCATV